MQYVFSTSGHLRGSSGLFSTKFPLSSSRMRGSSGLKRSSPVCFYLPRHVIFCLRTARDICYIVGFGSFLSYFLVAQYVMVMFYIYLRCPLCNSVRARFQSMAQSTLNSTMYITMGIRKGLPNDSTKIHIHYFESGDLCCDELSPWFCSGMVFLPVWVLPSSGGCGWGWYGADS